MKNSMGIKVKLGLKGAFSTVHALKSQLKKCRTVRLTQLVIERSLHYDKTGETEGKQLSKCIESLFFFRSICSYFCNFLTWLIFIN